MGPAIKPGIETDAPSQTRLGEATDRAALGAWVRALENVFIDIRGRGVQWSEADTALATEWFRQGRALPAVIRAIEQRVKALRFVRGEAALPRHLAYYDSAVARLDSGDPDRATAPAAAASRDHESPQALPAAVRLLMSLIDEVPALVETAADPAVAGAYRKAGAALGKALLGDGQTEEPPGGAAVTPDLASALQSSEDVLVRTLLKGIGATEAGRVREELDRRLAAEPRGGSKAARAARERVLLTRLLAQTHALRVPTADGWRCAGGDLRSRVRKELT